MPQTRAFHLTAFAADEEADAAPAEGPVKLYVGNLSWGIDDASLGDIFAEYDASEMTVVTDVNSGRSRGFGFVTVANQAEADKAIASLDGVVRARARALSLAPFRPRSATSIANPTPIVQTRAERARRLEPDDVFPIRARAVPSPNSRALQRALARDRAPVTPPRVTIFFTRRPADRPAPPRLDASAGG